MKPTIYLDASIPSFYYEDRPGTILVPYFLNVLRVLDIPEALGLLAPDVKLTLINARDPAFDRTAALYLLAGAAGKFVRK